MSSTLFILEYLRSQPYILGDLGHLFCTLEKHNFKLARGRSNERLKLKGQLI